jgi:hypothetical protein
MKIFIEAYCPLVSLRPRSGDETGALAGELLAGRDARWMMLRTLSMADSAHQQVIALAAKHNLSDEELLPMVAAYGDVVSVWLNEPSPPGSMPMSFAEFLVALDRALADQPAGA